MAKTKSKKFGLSDKIQNKRKRDNTLKSPFEVHINKQKINVLGRKTKHDKGFPGLSRAKAIDKRKKTLLEEFNVRNKSNVFKDRRIAENDPSLSVEEKQFARFAAIRQKAHKKKSIFNLGDDNNFLYSDGEEDVLTHKGQALDDIEKFDDPRSDDETDDEDNGNLSRNFTSQVHFGGGLLSTQKEGKSSKDILEQIIADSKQRRAEKQQTKEELRDLTDKLDAEWKDFHPIAIVNQKPKVLEKDPVVDEFIRLKNKLLYESRCAPSDPTKAEDEIAKEEKEKFEKLEKERLERMTNVEEIEMDKYERVDDLDENVVYESLSEDDENEGEVQNGLTEEEIDEQDEKEPINEQDYEEKVDEEEQNDEENQSESDSEDDLSDLKADSSDSEDEIIDEEQKVSCNEEISGSLPQASETDSEEQNIHIPETFTFPEDDEKLHELLEGHSAAGQGLIIKRIMKCHDTGLSEGNKEKLVLLFKYILQYLNDITSEIAEKTSLTTAFSIFDAISPHLFDLAQINKKPCSEAVLEVVKEKFQEYIKKPKSYPDLEVLFFLKMVSYLFPTSDFRHGVVTPCFVFMEKMLMSCRVKTRRHISYGLFLSTLVLEYTTLSKRFMPGCINFLGGILHMAVPKSVRIIKVLPPFKPLSADLVLVEDYSSKSLLFKMEAEDLINEKVTESFKVRAFYTALRLTVEYFENFKEYPNNLEIFESIYRYCILINLEVYPKEVQQEMNKFIKAFEDVRNNRKLSSLKMEAAKPKILKLYEPAIVDVYDRKSHKIQSREKAERSKLLHKLKREKKGARREIRRDNAFLGNEKINRQIQSDRERREKVKRIYAEANIQQSELNALDRKKRKK